MSAGTDEIGEMLQKTLTLLQKEFPDARVREVSLSVSAGDRNDHGNPQDWVRARWYVQVGNVSGSDVSLDEALIELREKITRDERMRKNAVQLATILKELPAEHFERSETVRRAEQIVENERRSPYDDCC